MEIFLNEGGLNYKLNGFHSETLITEAVTKVQQNVSFKHCEAGRSREIRRINMNRAISGDVWRECPVPAGPG